MKKLMAALLLFISCGSEISTPDEGGAVDRSSPSDASLRPNLAPRSATIRIVLDASLTDMERLLVLSSAVRWNDIVGREVFVTSRTEGVVIWFDDVEGIGIAAQAYNMRQDTTDPRQRVAFYRQWRRATVPQKANVSLHELGHILGLNHGPEGVGCLMNGPGTWDLEGPCQAEIDLVRGLYGFR